MNNNRVVLVDFLRGFALMGIVLIHCVEDELVGVEGGLGQRGQNEDHQRPDGRKKSPAGSRRKGIST